MRKGNSMRRSRRTGTLKRILARGGFTRFECHARSIREREKERERERERERETQSQPEIGMKGYVCMNM